MKILPARFLVLDTETADLTGAVYDIGWTICDRSGNILETFNALVSETVTNPQKMMGAFYANKIFSHYLPMLDMGTIRIRAWDNIVSTLNEHIDTFDVTCIAAYNAAFDFRVLGATHKMLGGTGRVLQKPTKTLDLWRFACETKLKQKAYAKIAQAEGWVSAAGNIKSGAEYAYRFCSGDFGFIEDHTALSDARIETAILAECLRQKRKIPYGQIKGAPWKMIQPKKSA